MEFKDIEGKTIKTAQEVMLAKGSNEDRWLLLKFTDGTSCQIRGFYDRFADVDRKDDIPTSIIIDNDDHELIPAPDTFTKSRAAFQWFIDQDR
jgi:hypothetical protein